MSELGFAGQTEGSMESLSVDMLDAFVERLKERKQLSEAEIKALCEKVRAPTRAVVQA